VGAPVGPVVRGASPLGALGAIVLAEVVLAHLSGVQGFVIGPVDVLVKVEDPRLGGLQAVLQVGGDAGDLVVVFGLRSVGGCPSPTFPAPLVQTP
jgi:hypothetical protein